MVMNPSGSVSNSPAAGAAYRQQNPPIVASPQFPRNHIKSLIKYFITIEFAECYKHVTCFENKTPRGQATGYLNKVYLSIKRCKQRGIYPKRE
jgi:hypothetical protein